MNASNPQGQAPGIDSQVHDYLPTWLLQAPAQRLLALSRALQLSQQQRTRVAAVLSTIEPLDGFARSLLRQQLRTHTGANLDVELNHFVHTRHLSLTSTLLSLPRQGSTAVVSSHSLLQAALQNFSAAEAASGGLAGKARLQFAQPLAASTQLTPESFAALCRTLDLGGRYQSHLDQVLTGEFTQVLRRSHYHDLEVAALIAALNGTLDEYSFKALLQHVHTDFLQPGEDPVIRPLQVRLGGVLLSAVVVFEVLPESAFSLTPGVLRFERLNWLLYIPGDAQRPLLRFNSRDAMARELGQRLQSPAYERLFMRFVPQAEQLAFAATLAERRQRAEKGEPLVLPMALTAFPGPLFSTLANQQVAKIRNDARTLAVPTADEDENERVERLHAYENAGLLLLNVAGLFVPVLGAVMLGVAAGQLLSQVLEGVEDWLQGDSDKALEHLTDVVETLALFAAAGAGVQLVSKALRHAAFIEELVPISNAGGQARLWKPDLAGYAASEAGIEQGTADSQGLISGSLRHYIKLDERLYAVDHDAALAQWRIVQPQTPERYSPVLHGNGRGGWRHGGENPLLWHDSRFMLKRLLPELATLPEPAQAQVLTMSGLDGGQLRRLHLDDLPAPGLLRDCLLRWRLDHDIERFIEQLAQGAALDTGNAQMADYLLSHLPAGTTGSAAPTVLARHAGTLRQALFEHCYGLRTRLSGIPETVVQVDFPELPNSLVGDLVEAASDLERERLEQQWRVPLSMANRLRAPLYEVRVSRAVEGLYLQSVRSGDSDRLVLALLGHLAGWPRDLAIELLEGSLSGPAFVPAWATSASRRVQIVRLESGYQLYRVAGEGEFCADLFSALRTVLTSTEQAALEAPQAGLRSRLGELLHQHRDQVGQWLQLMPEQRPWFNPPQRLADGRIGYPLSGRGLFGGRRAAQVRDVRQLYPGLSDTDADSFVDALQRSGVDVAARIKSYQREFKLLDDTLRAWSKSLPGGEAGQAMGRSRQQAALLIRRAWRKLSPKRLSNHSVIGYSLSLEGLRTGELPGWPAEVSFDHVVDLQLHNMGLGDASAVFLQPFQRLRELNLGNNALTRVPDALGRMPALTRLLLPGNQIELDQQAATLLAGLSQLRWLNLNDNPIGPLLDLERLSRLEEVQLRNTGLQAWPSGLLNRFHGYRLDLRNNQIEALPQAVLDAPGWINRALALHDNPLSEQTLEQLEHYQQRTGIRLTSRRSHLSPASRARRLWLQTAPAGASAQALITWQALADEPQASALLQLLADLSTTAEFQRTPADLGVRVWALLEATSKAPELRESLFELAASPITCGDSVTLNFTTLETRASVYVATHLESDQPLAQRLLRLGRRLFRQEQLDLLVAEQVEARAGGATAVDAVELNLAYRIALGEALDLPSKPQSMLFPALAPLDGSEIAGARQRIEGLEQTPALQQFISTRDFWLEHLKEQHKVQFEALDRPYRDQLDTIMNSQSVLRDADYLERLRALASARDQAEASLALRFTEEAWAAFGSKAATP
ncbi:NEL-type E3 ubiquitin ligase domain-containing protein [Pseudomonas sp. 2835]|uniref:NEL-type E3 ubiquitin ligase domain-containing protein n=1 Tax=Pseudomonas sp. 2835 TaxID=3156451 RepID=UPI003D218584